MIEKGGICNTCSYVITNPVCERCYINQVSTWLVESAIGKRTRGKIIRATKATIPQETFAGRTCILCKREFYRTCAYCFFLNVAKVLKKEKIPDNKIHDFLDIFNYRHFKEEYPLFSEPEAEELEPKFNTGNFTNPLVLRSW